MENVRIAILSAQEDICTFLDNASPKALHYYNEELHTYLKGSAATFAFSANARHEDSQYLVEGNKLAFVYKGKDYFFNIMRVDEDEVTIKVTALSLSFELLNEYADEYKATKALSFAEYVSIFDSEGVLTININEVSENKVWIDFSQETLLARMYSLAEAFMAEVEFVPVLGKNYSLDKLIVNVFKDGRNTDKHHGIGQERTDIVLRYGKEVSGIKRQSDITNLYTAIRPYGRDGLTIKDYVGQVKDESGNIEYETVAGSLDIRAHHARDRFPSNRWKNGYIVKTVKYDEGDVASLYLCALNDLKANCVPQVTYDVSGVFDANIGDTISVEDEAFNPPLYLSARITEQVISFTNPVRNKTTFSNVKEHKSEISADLIQRMQALIEANKVYAAVISTDNGITFKNGEGTTTLTAVVREGGSDLTEQFTIQWTKNGEYISGEKSIVVNAADINEKAVYRFAALDSNGNIRAEYEVTVTNVSDGVNGDSSATIKEIQYFYLLQDADKAVPSKPEIYPPTEWSKTEPTYDGTTAKKLYTVVCTVFEDDSFTYSEVSLSSSYEAAKDAYDKAVANAEKILAWCHENDKVYIDGAKIYAASITALQLATDAIKSLNYKKDESGSFLNLADGSFDSKFLKWTQDGKLMSTGGTIGGVSIGDDGLSAEGTDEGGITYKYKIDNAGRIKTEETGSGVDYILNIAASYMKFLKYGTYSGSNPQWIAISPYGIEAGTISNTPDIRMMFGHDGISVNGTNLSLLAHPIGSIYIAADHISPAERFGGTWARISGYFLWASGESEVIKATGGSPTETLTLSQIPYHEHELSKALIESGQESSATLGLDGSQSNFNGRIMIRRGASSSATPVTATGTGGGGAHNNMPPYITVSVWERIE